VQQAVEQGSKISRAGRGFLTQASWHGLGLLLGDHGAADGHDGGDDAVDALGGFVLGWLEAENWL
jgi:hypothetical protein